MTEGASKPTQMEIIAEEMHEGGFAFVARVPKDLKYFEGHFKQEPVLAGVVQIYWVMDLLSTHLGYRPQFLGLEAVKFHQLMFPGQEFHLTLTHSATGTKWSYQITTKGQKVASGRILVANETDPK